MKDYLQKIKNNIWNHAYYEEILAKPLSASFKYYIKMSLWLVLVYTAFVSIMFLPTFVSTARQMVSGFADAFPAELKVHLNDGKVSVNMPEPVIIPLSENEKAIFKGLEKKIGVPQNLIVIDSRTNFDLAEFNNYRSLMVLKKDAMAGIGNDGEVRVRSFPAGNMIVAGEDIKNVASKLQSVILFIAPLGVLAIYFLGVIFFIFTIGYLILIALFVWLLLYVAKRNLTLWQSLGVTLHASTFALIVNFFIFVLYPSLSINFPFLVTFTLLIIYLNLIRKPRVAIAMPVAPTNIPVDTVAKAEEEKKS